jgi:hypothetical protein
VHFPAVHAASSHAAACGHCAALVHGVPPPVLELVAIMLLEEPPVPLPPVPLPEVN